MVDSEYTKNENEISAQIKHIAERLREEREKLRISQMDLSYKAGLSQNQVNYIETGKRTPNLYTLLSICNALQINPAVLFFGKEGMECLVKFFRYSLTKPSLHIEA
jgi:transcriptional regulator with XRE-family HTH domain